ncbi:hypothetical protein BH11MYX2_BH11MYX2_12510 [soil metagenome]
MELDSALPEGAEVLVTPELSDETFELSDAEVNELAARMEAAKRGEVVPAAEVLAGLRARR